MKQLVGSDIGAYTFSPSTKTVTLLGVTGMTKAERLLIITNVTTGKILYLFNDPSLALQSLIYNSGVTPVSTVITLNASIDFTGMSATDKLQIYIESSQYNNPFGFMPRGHMFNIDTRHGYVNKLQYPAAVNSFDSFCFVESYPTTTVASGCNNAYPNGANLAFDCADSLVSPNNHGVYVKPAVGKSLYLETINFVVEVANQVDVSKALDRTGATLQLSHSGNIYCEARSVADLIVIGSDVKQMDSVFSSHFTTYIIPIISKPAGLFNGTNGDYFQIRMSNGRSLQSDYITHMYFSFSMWEVSQ